MFARLSALLFVLLFVSTAYAGSTKVNVCHIPPDNPENFHTIKITEKALAAHLAHGDFAGACDDVCEVLCDDGDACTDDKIDDCEINGCAVMRDPVDCNDGLDLCVTSTCDSNLGCSDPVPVTCDSDDQCSSLSCDPTDGLCSVETPVSCDPGEACSTENGCEPIVACPCWAAGELLSVSAGNQNPTNSCSTASSPFIQNVIGSTPGVEGGFVALDGACGTRDFGNNNFISLVESDACIQQIYNRCAEIGDSVPADTPVTSSSAVSSSSTTESNSDPVFDW